MPIFDRAALTKAIQETVPDLKPGEKLVIGTVDEVGAKILVSAEVVHTTGPHNLRVDLGTDVHHNWDGDDGAGAQVILRWM